MTHSRTRRSLAPIALLALVAAAYPSVGHAQQSASFIAEVNLIVPVEGVTAQDLRDTFSQARSGGRVHDAIDIHAPRGTPVLAAADGEIIQLHSGDRGGLSLYHLDADGRTRYYYAHLSAYADGIVEGRRVRQGEVIGYVGDTGNAQPGDYHLHFSVAILQNRRRWWEGRNLNPYVLLGGRNASRSVAIRER